MQGRDAFGNVAGGVSVGPCVNEKARKACDLAGCKFWRRLSINGFLQRLRGNCWLSGGESAIDKVGAL